MNTKDLTFVNSNGLTKELRWIKSHESKDIELLWQLGRYIKSKGCLAGFSNLITKMYLTSQISGADAHRIRELTEGSDLQIGDKMVEPRLQILRDKIEILIKNS